MKLSFGYGKQSLTKPEEKVTDAATKRGIQIKLGSQVIMKCKYDIDSGVVGAIKKLETWI